MATTASVAGSASAASATGSPAKASSLPRDSADGHRWTIERVIAWLNGYRRLHRRYERKVEHFLACATIAGYRRLTS